MKHLGQQLRRMRDRSRGAKRTDKWRSLFLPYFGDECVALDLETTSLDPNKAEIISIGAVIIKRNQIKTSERLDIRIRSMQPLPEEAIKIHFIRSMDLADGVSIEQALERLLAFVGNRPLVGYYIDFDVSVLERVLRQVYGFGLTNKTYDIMTLYKRQARHLAQDQSTLSLAFEDIAAALDVPEVGRHTAIGDAITIALMYVKLRERR